MDTHSDDVRRVRRSAVVVALVAGLLAGGAGGAGGLLLAGYERPAQGPAAAAGAAAAADPVASATATPQVDPYEVWLDRAPEGAPELSREDAQARAALGCGQQWAPGTVDAILQEVYADYVDC